MPFLQRMLSPVVQLRREEVLTALLMFGFSFLVMTVWNTVKPVTRSQFIRDLGADNLPYVLLVAGFAAYAFTFMRFWGRDILFILVVTFRARGLFGRKSALDA